MIICFIGNRKILPALNLKPDSGISIKMKQEISSFCLFGNANKISIAMP